MSTLLKIGITGLIVGLAYAGMRKASNSLTFEAKGFGVPRILSGSKIEVPVIIQFENKLPVNVPVNSLSMVINQISGNQAIEVGTLKSPSFQIKEGVSAVNFFPLIDLKRIAGNSLQTILQAVKGNPITLRADIVVNVSGIDWRDSVIKTISI